MAKRKKNKPEDNLGIDNELSEEEKGGGITGVLLAAVIIVMFLLRENPTVMVNILYIIAIIAALWIWKNPKS